MKQKDIFLESEGDAWLDRNRTKLGLYDPITPVIEELGITPKVVLEVGCANGWRLGKLRDKYGCQVWGIDPSMKAVMACADYRVPAWQMTASTLPVLASDVKFDLIIYGFCLYLTDPSDWLTIAAEADRNLVDNGHLIVHDFSDSTYFRKYEHDPRLRAYHVDFAALWMAHPLYTVRARRFPEDGEEVTALKKLPASSIGEHK